MQYALHSLRSFAPDFLATFAAIGALCVEWVVVAAFLYGGIWLLAHCAPKPRREP